MILQLPTLLTSRHSGVRNTVTDVVEKLAIHRELAWSHWSRIPDVFPAQFRQAIKDKIPKFLALIYREDWWYRAAVAILLPKLAEQGDWTENLL